MMKILGKLIELVNVEMEVPRFLGTFHVIFCVLVALSCALAIRMRDTSDRRFRISIAVMFSVMAILEIMKQFVFHMSVSDGRVTLNYSFGDFPFQLCSTPLYVLPLLSFLPDSRLRDFAASYTMTFGIIGGLAVYLVPKSVFINRVFINFQTMIHHGLQIVSGIFTAAYFRRRVNRSFFYGGVKLFFFFFIIANLLNTVGYEALVALGAIEVGDSFNMFYISPRPDQQIPMLSSLIKGIPPVIYIVGYFVVLTLISAFIAFLTRQITDIENTEDVAEASEL